MKRIAMIGLALALAGCATGPKPRMSADALIPLVKEYAFRDEPTLDASTQFKVEERRVDGLQEEMGIQLFSASYLSNGNRFDERYFIYHNGTLTPFACSIGGFGLMSTVVSDGALYYTYSWGSGIHRSQIGRLSIEGDRIEIVESGGYIGTDLFVSKGDNEIVVKRRCFEPKPLGSLQVVGTVKRKGSSLVIVDAAGAEVSSNFAFAKQQPEPATNPAGE
jgi:hypothetical protein